MAVHGFVPLDSYADKDGKVDWDRYHEAQIAHGDVCCACQSFIVFPLGHRGKCNSCMSLATSKVEVSHEKYVRCPKCGKVWAPDSYDEGSLYEDGDHEVFCNECDTKFTVVTSVSFSFRSPPLLKEDEEDAGPDREDPVCGF